MSKLTDHAAYLRGLADGMNIDTDKPQNKLLLEVLKLVDEMAHAQNDSAKKLDELSDYVEEIDGDLSELESYLYGEDDEDCDCHDCHDCHCDCDHDDIHFECPSCGKAVVIDPDDIEAEESPVCPYCGEPFFTDIGDDDEENSDDSDEESESENYLEEAEEEKTEE